mgnify:CR=1 FL=1
MNILVYFKNFFCACKLWVVRYTAAETNSSTSSAKFCGKNVQILRLPDFHICTLQLTKYNYLRLTNRIRLLIITLAMCTKYSNIWFNQASVFTDSYGFEFIVTLVATDPRNSLHLQSQGDTRFWIKWEWKMQGRPWQSA